MYVCKPFFTITSCTVAVMDFMDHVIIHNGLFAECKVLDNLRGLCGPRTRTCGLRTRTCKLVLNDPQGLSSRTTTLTSARQRMVSFSVVTKL